MVKDCKMRHENGNCWPAGGFCTANRNICEALQNAYSMGQRDAVRLKGHWVLADNQREEDVENGNYLFICTNCFHSDLHSKSELVPFCRFCGADMEEGKMIDKGTILEVTRTLVGETEPYGDSAIDRMRTENLDKLLYVVGGLMLDVEMVAINKNRYEGSMRMMGERAHKELNRWWSCIGDYLREDDNDEIS